MSETSKPKDPVYNDKDKARLTKVFDTREVHLHYLHTAWYNMSKDHSFKLFAVPMKLISDLCKVNRIMQRILIETASIPRIKHFAEVFETAYYNQYLGMKYAASDVLREDGWTFRNIVDLYKAWKKLEADMDEEPEVVTLAPRSDTELQNFIRLFDYFADPILDNYKQEICDEGFVPKNRNFECQVSLPDLNGKPAESLAEDPAPIDKKDAGPIDAWRDEMNSVLTQAEFPNPMIKAEIGLTPIEEFVYDEAAIAQLEWVQLRSGSLSSSTCSGLSESEEDAFVRLRNAEWPADFSNGGWCNQPFSSSE